MHVVISLLLQSTKLWWYLLLSFSMLLHGVIMTSYWWQRYAECLVTTLCSNRTVHRHTTPHTCNSWTAASRTPNFLAPNLWPPNNPDLSPVDYEIWGAMQNRVYRRQIHSVDELKRRLIDVWCCLNSQFLTRLFTCREEDIERVFTLKDDISSTACELTMLILSISVVRYWQNTATYLSNFNLLLTLLLTLWRHFWRHRKSPLLSLLPLRHRGP